MDLHIPMECKFPLFLGCWIGQLRYAYSLLILPVRPLVDDVYTLEVRRYNEGVSPRCVPLNDPELLKSCNANCRIFFCAQIRLHLSHDARDIPVGRSASRADTSACHVQPFWCAISSNFSKKGFSSLILVFRLFPAQKLRFCILCFLKCSGILLARL